MPTFYLNIANLSFLRFVSCFDSQLLNLLAASLAYNRKLCELDVSGNNISNSGARILAQSLSVNKSIR